MSETLNDSGASLWMCPSLASEEALPQTKQKKVHNLFFHLSFFLSLDHKARAERRLQSCDSLTLSQPY